MPKVEIRNDGTTVQYELLGRALVNGDTIELRLGGNRGWESVTVEGLPTTLRVRTVAYDGMSVVTSLPRDAEIRWPAG